MKAWSSLQRYVAQRWLGWAFLAVLLAVAIFSTQIALTSKAQVDVIRMAKLPKHEADFEAERSVTFKFGDDGVSQSVLFSPFLRHYRDDDSADLVKPVLIVNHANGAQTSIRSTAAKVVNGGEWIGFAGNVLMERNVPKAQQKSAKNNSFPNLPAGLPDSTLSTETLAFNADTQDSSSQSPARMSKGRDVVEAAGGYTHDYRAATLVFNGRVRTVLAPR